ncbi:GNAT family N-acetyltransferase [Ornithinimicrobium pratense]|uniref:GNAT family N-acetyltransferase n=1 Tax=Ornithinimicrobium pratense TaxID=2593973 RepID=A0A5J6V4N2_9MICO|nr:GNAT family N-acetyltransferase [Ornithinimicrobium pratense]QFG68940.1 GNAT family N-acetyltransferase [Ornithinimicrobium pratense]
MSPDPISRGTARHAVWDDVCDAYHLVDRTDLGVVEEAVPSGAQGRPHQHARSREFFYVLAGEATIALGPQEVRVEEGSGVEVPAGTWHQVRNEGEDELRLLVVSSPRVADSGPRQSPRPFARDRSGLVVGSHLRRTRRGDLKDVLSFEQEPETQPFLGQGGREWHERALADPDMEHWVLVDRLDRVVAFGILAGLFRPDIVEIRRMVVAPEGRGQGLGRLLLRQLLEQALASSEVSRVWLDVSADNTGARSLYRSMGFQERPTPAEVTLLEDGVYMEWSGQAPTLAR